MPQLFALRPRARACTDPAASLTVIIPSFSSLFVLTSFTWVAYKINIKVLLPPRPDSRQCHSGEYPFAVALELKACVCKLNIEVMPDTDHAFSPIDSSTRYIPLEIIYAILTKLSPIEDKPTLASAMRVSLAINRMAAPILYSQLEIFCELYEDEAYPPLISQGSQEVVTGRGVYGRTVAQFVKHVVIFDHPKWVCLKMSEIDHLPKLETVRIGRSMAQAYSLCPAPHTCKLLAASSPSTLTMAHNNKCALDHSRLMKLGLHTVSLMEPTMNWRVSIIHPSPDPLAPPAKIVEPVLDRPDIPLIVIGPTEPDQAVPAQLESRLVERHAAALRERCSLPGRTTPVGVFTRNFDARLIISALSRPEIDVTPAQIGLFTEAEHQAC
jgi:hypothetical protein